MDKNNHLSHEKNPPNGLLSRRAHRSLLLLEQQKASTGLSHEPFQAPRETCQSYTLDCCKNKGYQGYTS